MKIFERPSQAGALFTDAPRAPAVMPAVRLLQFEAEIRRQPSEAALLFHLTNELGGLVPCHQVWVWRRQRGTGHMQACQVSGLTQVDRTASAVRAFQQRLADADRLKLLDSALSLDISQPLAAVSGVPAASTEHDKVLAEHPGRLCLWLPLPTRSGRVDAGVLFTRDTPFAEAEQTVLQRLAETYAHAWAALTPGRGFRQGLRLRAVHGLGLAVLLAGVSMVPVRLSVMAPMEVVAAEPYVVTAPISGVVKSLQVPPNAEVRAGQALVLFDDIQPRNEAMLTGQRLAVAKARHDRLASQSFDDPAAGHELAIARAEYDMALVNQQYAYEVLKRTQVLAPAAGMALFSDRRDWEGRSVQVGEELVQVADPSRVAYRIALPTGNSVALDAGDVATVYLDDAPLGGLPARVRSMSYTPQVVPGGETAYTVYADPVDGAAGHAPRIGARGTVRLYGEDVPLAVQLFRRPWAATRQFLGL